MRILGLDYGDRRIGVAISDELGWTAQGLEVIDRKNREHDLNRLREIIIQYNMDEIVVGLPKNMNGSIGPRGETCILFAQGLEQAFGIPARLWDERLTTVSAQKVLIEADMSRRKRKQVVDKIAAVFILQGYLDSKMTR
jgi:putative Holliday junction resolvase